MKCCILFCLALSWSFMLPVQRVTAQGIEMPRDEQGREVPLPTKAMDVPQSLLDANTKENEAWEVAIAVSGLEPRLGLALDSAKNPTETLKYLQSVYVVYRFAGNENSGPQLLVASRNVNGEEGEIRKVLGWVREDYAILRPHAMVIPSTRIRKKAMAITRLEEGKAGESTKYRNGPSSRAAETNDELKFFNVLYVYAETKNAAYATARERESDYILVGTQQSKPVAQSWDKGVILGWIPQDKVVRWNTAEAIEFNKSTSANRPMAKIYSEPGVAKKAFDGSTQSVPGLFEEDNASMKPCDMRFPILELPDKLVDVDGKEFLKNYKGNRLFRVGVIGGLGGKSAGEVDSIRTRQVNLNAQMAKAQILFVVDDTGSMKVCFEQVSNAIQQIAKATTQAQDTEVAIAFYNDAKVPQNAVNLTPGLFPLFPLKPVALERVVRLLESHETNAGEGDYPEMLATGLKTAISKCNFSPDARKLVVLIGDAGSKEYLSNPEQFGELSSSFLPKGQTPIELMVLQVGSAAGETSVGKADTPAKAALLFTQQTDALIKRINEAPELKNIYTSRQASRLQINSTEVALQTRQRIVEIKLKLAEAFEQLSSATEGNRSAKIDEEYLAIIRRANPDFEELLKQKGVQSFREGFVWHDSFKGVSQIKFFSMLEKSDLEGLVSDIRKLGETNRQVLGKKPKVEDAVAQVVGAMVREGVDPDVPAQDQFFKQYGIQAQTPLLRQKLREDGRSVKIKQQETIEILHRCDLLEDILKGVERTWTIETRDDYKYYDSRGQPVLKQRACRTRGDGNGTFYYWIETEKEIP